MSDLHKIESAFNLQKKFFLSQATRSVESRKHYLNALKESLERNKAEIHDALAKDLGKTPEIVDLAESGAVIEEIDAVLAGLDQWTQDEHRELGGFLAPSKGIIRHEPYGVVYIIGPFNYPLNLTLTPLIGAIAAGNTAILKPSEGTPNTSAVIEKIIAETFPAEYVTVIQGGREENELLLAQPFDFIFFTGSPNVGKVVMAAAAKNLTPVVLELGGKCPVIVVEDADIDALVEKVTFAKYLNSGQTCVSADYLLVDNKIYDQVVDKLTARLVADYQDPKATGKIVSSNQVKKLAEYLQNTQGKISFGGKYSESERYMQATLVEQVSWDDALMQQEIFGPILPVLRFDKLEDAIKDVVHYHPKPLAVYVFTQDESLGHHVINSIQSGDAQINDVLTHALSSELPFGGIGPSGMGKYHGKTSFDTYSHQKSIRIVE